MIRVLLVDDEPLARKGLRAFLSSHREYEVVGESSDGVEAVAHIQSLQPDLVFLDIQMPGMDGFGVIRTIGAERMPAVVFVTAYDQHALEAFKVHALDYLLKPIDTGQFAATLERIQFLLRNRQQDRILALLESMEKPANRLQRFIVRSAGRMIVVPVSDIEYLEADGDYVRVYTQTRYHLIRERLGHLEGQLDPTQFIRIHRSTIVRIDRIRELKPLFNGDHLIILRDGKQLSLSRTYKDSVLAVLGGQPTV